MPQVAVRFNYGSSYNNKIFIQPLYYLAEQIKQILYKKYVSSSYCEEKLDTNLIITTDVDVFKLEMLPVHNWDENNFNYFLNRYDADFRFIYKNCCFSLKNINCDSSNTIIMENRDEYTIYSSYTIEYGAENIDIFEDFLKTTIKYYEKYSIVNTNIDMITIYITSTDGYYFQVLGKRNKRDIDSIYLPNKHKKDIITDLETFINPNTKKRYNKLGITYKRTYLLEGMPGTGKTSLITGLASKFNANIALVSFTPKMTDVDLIRALRTLKEYEDDKIDSSKKKRIFLVFEDIDCIFKERKSNDEQRNNITFSGLLNALDGITTNDLICFITTNYKHNLDSALLRPGRIDYVMQFDYATKEQIIAIYNDFTDSRCSIKSNMFYDACYGLNIKITTALLQQYLMKYIDKPDDAIEHIDEMKSMFDMVNVTKQADESGLYI